ncbi:MULTISPECIES: hypothetical protein [Trichocoleus]|uniref:Uncharacterized protein n=1 Tax=Trichocoleus desertorum GB2-A4 TaxID=2933944 RepID=A0ABV0J718_9CYAN|nr:hypothetical protein [Trichocoleus sp. FACHB-46]MBD1862541.1 hypothetical protein [Trichocoleus sp. FACHB-46]
MAKLAVTLFTLRAGATNLKLPPGESLSFVLPILVTRSQFVPVGYGWDFFRLKFALRNPF